jgi:hypothetical protein
MSDPIRALALPPREPYAPAWPNGNGYGFHTLPPAEDESVFWRLTKRYWKLLLVCGLVSLAVAYVAGKMFGRPTWQADATLIYQPVALSEKQRAAYEHPPGLPTLSQWVKEPALLRQVSTEFHLGLSEDDLADRYVKVDQPPSTEAVVISFKWGEPDVARNALNRLAELYIDYVVTARKEAILLRIEKLDQQAAYACEDEMRRLDQRAKVLDDKLAKTGKLGDEDLDGTMLARRNELRSEIRNQDQKRKEMRSDLTFKREQLPQLQDLVAKNVEPRYKLTALSHEVERLELDIKHAEEKVAAAEIELKTLPLQLTKAKYNELRLKLDYLKDELKRHAEARALLGKPGGPPARGALEGMDAKEFAVKSPARVGDAPVSSSKKTLMAGTFLALMAGVFGLLFVYDRRHPWIDGGPGSSLRGRVIHVTPPPGGPAVGPEVEAHRLSARMSQWLSRENGPLVTPPPETEPPVTVDEANGQPPPPAEGVDPDTDHLAQRMQQWLGDGTGPR